MDDGENVVDELLLDDAKLVLAIIEETLEAHDPYYQVDFDPSCPPRLGDCEFPDHIDDPLALVRFCRGEACVQRLEYEDDLEATGVVLEQCIRHEEAKRRVVRD